MKNEPDIVKSLRAEEKEGKLQSQLLMYDSSSVCQSSEKDIKIEEEKYRELLEEFQFLAENTLDIIFQMASTGEILYINAAVEHIAGYKPEELIGKNFINYIPKRELPKYFKILKGTLKGVEIESFEGHIVHKDGHLVLLEYSGKVVEKGNQKVIIGTIKDITERKKTDEERKKHAEELRAMNEKLQKTQEELRALNEELEEKIKERTAEVEKLLKAKDEFIGQLGHDLKSPLTPLIGLLPMVEEEEKDPKLKELINVSIRNVKYMRDLVVKTLQLERLNSPNTIFTMDEVDLVEVVDLVIDTKQLIFKEAEISVKNNINKSLIVQGDRLQLNEIFDNLLTNAAKFTPKGGSVTIDVVKEKEKVIISVKDTGIGMTQQQIDHVFEEFYKVDPARHDLESSGLGLSICKRIAEKHGGKIWAESPGLNKGTTFKFSLPYKQKKR